MYQHNKLSVTNAKFWHVNNYFKSVLKQPNLLMLSNIRDPLLPWNLDVAACWKLPLMFPTKVNILFVLYLQSFAGIFFENSKLYVLDISLRVSSKIILKCEWYPCNPHGGYEAFNRSWFF